MKKEIRRKIESISNEIGSASAAAEAERIINDLETEYDKRLSDGMSELEAYREILKNTESIEALLHSMPKTDAEIRRDERKKNAKQLKKKLDKVSAVLWLVTVLVYFIFSFTVGYWHLSWLIFLYATIGQIIISMVEKYNSGKSLKHTLRDGLSAVLWLATVIVYFLFSFTVGYWHLTWLIFIVATIVQIILKSITNE